MIKAAIFGYGTVGSGIYEVLTRNSAVIQGKLGDRIEVKYVLDLREFPGDPVQDVLVHDVNTILDDEEVSIICETMGGEKPAYDFTRRALELGKSVCTSNKELVEKHGAELLKIAQEHHCSYLFEASVGGGIPIIRPLKSCLAANKVTSVMGIVNGTTNYMLTKMSQENMDYADVLREAQEKGYAESDPTADVGGLDAARKLVILASIAFNTRIDLSDDLVEGIDGLDLCDIEHGKELGYAIKLLAIAKNNAEHGISVCVRPTMLPVSHPLAGVNDVFNAIFVTGDAIGDAMFMGRGAGKMPTASAVCGDIIDVARNIIHKSNGRINCTCFDEKHLCSLENMMSPCYIRLHVQDKPGVLAAIAAAFGAQNVSLKNVVQKSKVKGVAELVVITYDVSELNLQMAVQTLKALPIVEKVCSVIRVEDHDLE